MLCLWWICANLQFADKLDSGGSSDMWVACCPSRWSLYWPLGLVVDHLSLSIIPTERQVLACESISWLALWAEPFCLLEVRQTHKLGWMVVGANLQLKDKLEAPQVGTSGPSQQRHSRRYYQNRTALHCLSTAHSDYDTTVVHWVKWKFVRQCQCICVPLHTRQVVQAMLHCAMLSCAEEECAQRSPCLDHIFLIETSINLTNVKAWFSTKLSTGEYLQILQNQYESKHSSV